MNTIFATLRNPWTGADVPPEMTMKKASQFVNIDLLELAIDPLPTARIQPNKYEALLKTMVPGQCIRCQPREVNQISSALRKHIELHSRKSKNGELLRVITQKNAGDGIGRVWMVEDTRRKA